MGKIAKLIKKITINIPDGHEYYCGEYKDGLAEYVYIQTNEGTIMDGKFRFYSNHDSETYYKAEGIFERGKKYGFWQFETKTSDGVTKLYVNFINGIIEGDVEYNYEPSKTSNMKSIHILAYVSKEYINGKIVGRINGGQFKGWCDEYGHPDNEWSLTVKSGGKKMEIHKEIWQHGKLIDSFTENQKGERKNIVSTDLRDHLNNIFSYDCWKIMSIIGDNDIIYIPKK